jgi:gas vesicle protein
MMSRRKAKSYLRFRNLLSLRGRFNMKMILLKVMAGLTLGVAAGVLLAPQPGAETRRQLARGTARLRSRAKKLASNVRESDTRRRLMEESARVGTGIAEAVSSVAQQVGRTLGTARQRMRSESGDNSGYQELHDSQWRELENEPGEWVSSSPAWILMGGLLGVAIGILMAPKPGRETREELTRRVRQLRSRSEEMASDLISRNK